MIFFPIVRRKVHTYYKVTLPYRLHLVTYLRSVYETIAINFIPLVPDFSLSASRHIYLIPLAFHPIAALVAAEGKILLRVHPVLIQSSKLCLLWKCRYPSDSPRLSICLSGRKAEQQKHGGGPKRQRFETEI
jgi:hypothetical protein